MDVRFRNSFYLAAVKESENFNDDKKIFNFAKEHPQFKYGDVTFQKFISKYSSDGCFGQKVIALPAAICSGVVKTIYHLAKAILLGTPKALSDGGRYFKAQIFYVARDFQEAYGRLVSLFNDKYGQYHIQGSKFHKTCYNCFATNTSLSPTTGSSTSASNSNDVGGSQSSDSSSSTGFSGKNDTPADPDSGRKTSFFSESFVERSTSPNDQEATTGTSYSQEILLERSTGHNDQEATTGTSSSPEILLERSTGHNDQEATTGTSSSPEILLERSTGHNDQEATTGTSSSPERFLERSTGHNDQEATIGTSSSPEILLESSTGHNDQEATIGTSSSPEILLEKSTGHNVQEATTGTSSSPEIFLERSTKPIDQVATTGASSSPENLSVTSTNTIGMGRGPTPQTRDSGLRRHQWRVFQEHVAEPDPNCVLESRALLDRAAAVLELPKENESCTSNSTREKILSEAKYCQSSIEHKVLTTIAKDPNSLVSILFQNQLAPNLDEAARCVNTALLRTFHGFMESQQYQQATDALNAIRFTKAATNGYVRLATAYLDQDQLQEAIAVFARISCKSDCTETNTVCQRIIERGGLKAMLDASKQIEQDVRDELLLILASSCDLDKVHNIVGLIESKKECYKLLVNRCIEEYKWDNVHAFASQLEEGYERSEIAEKTIKKALEQRQIQCASNMLHLIESDFQRDNCAQQIVESTYDQIDVALVDLIAGISSSFNREKTAKKLINQWLKQGASPEAIGVLRLIESDYSREQTAQKILGSHGLKLNDSVITAIRAIEGSYTKNQEASKLIDRCLDANKIELAKKILQLIDSSFTTSTCRKKIDAASTLRQKIS